MDFDQMLMESSSSSAADDEAADVQQSYKGYRNLLDVVYSDDPKAKTNYYSSKVDEQVDSSSSS